MPEKIRPERTETNPHGGGAPRIEITEQDWTNIERMCELHLTGEDIAKFLGISYDTLEKRIKEKYEVGFAEYFDQKSMKGKINVRRAGYKGAVEGNVQLIKHYEKLWFGVDTDEDEKDDKVIVNVSINGSDGSSSDQLRFSSASEAGDVPTEPGD